MLVRWARTHGTVVLAVGLLLAVIGVLLGGCLIGQQRLVFRDVGHFYTPLYGYLADRERSEWLPLYNDRDATGLPLAGETTPAVYYLPRRLIYWLIADPATAIAWYVAAHWLLAGLAAGWAARLAGAGRAGVALAILVYPLSGPIWFLHCNPPFLVSAAWLPLALGGGLCLIRDSRRPVNDRNSSGAYFGGRSLRPRYLAITAVALAGMILGGDPQTAVHVGLLGAAVAAVASGRRVCRDRQLGEAIAIWGRLSLAVLLTAMLTAPQLAATWDWAGQSVRYQHVTRGESLAFSAAVWHWLELVVPYVWGQTFPQNTRISQAIAGDGRMWTITLFCGLIPLALVAGRYASALRGCVSALRGNASAPSGDVRSPRHNPLIERRRSRSLRWDAWDGLIPAALLLSAGAASGEAICRQFGWLSATQSLPWWGSPYGWLMQLIPGYDGFRYPAKWLVFLSLGMAIAAARQFRLNRRQLRRSLSNGMVGLGCTGLAMSLTVIAVVKWRVSYSGVAAWPADPLWGPFLPDAAIFVVAQSLLLIIGGAIATCLAMRCLAPRTATLCVLAIVSIELAIVGKPALLTIDRHSERLVLASTAPIGPAQASPAQTVAEPIRVLRAIDHRWPVVLREGRFAADVRVLAAEVSSRNTDFGRWHLMNGRAIFNPPLSLPAAIQVPFWRQVNQQAGGLRGEQRERYWSRVQSWLGMDAWLSGHHEITRLSAVDIELPLIVPHWQPTIDPPPQAAIGWLADWAVIDSDADWDDLLRRRIAEVTGRYGAADISVPLDESLVAIQSVRRGPQPPSAVSTTDGPRHPSIDPTHRDARTLQHLQFSNPRPGSWSIEVQSSAAGMLRIRQFQDGHLRARIRTLPSDNFVQGNEPTDNAAQAVRPAGLGSAVATAVYRCDGLWSAVWVPAGTHKIDIEYRPWWLSSCLWLAALSWAGLLSVVGWKLAVWTRRMRPTGLAQPLRSSSVT